MKVRGVFLGLSLLLVALPGEAQRGGGFGGRASSGRGFGGHASVRGGSGGSTRSVSRAPAVNVPRAVWVTRPSSAQVVVRSQPRPASRMAPGAIVQSQPRPVSRMASGAIIQSQPRPVSRMASGTIIQTTAASRPARRPTNPQFFETVSSFPPGHAFFREDFFFFHHHHIFAGGFGFPTFCFFSNGFRSCFFQPFFPRPFLSPFFSPFFTPFCHSPFFSPFFTPFVPFVGGVSALEPSGELAPNQVVGELGPAEIQLAGNEAAEPPEELSPSQPAAQPVPAKLALLVLKDGWTYELADYWIESGQLHYVTSYGGRNAVPLEAVDFDQTAQLNSERGVEFALRPKPRAR